MALMCHVIATSVRSGGLAVEVLSTHMSGVILHLAALSRFFVKSFFLRFADKKVLFRFWPRQWLPRYPSPSSARGGGGGGGGGSAFAVFRHELHWSGMGIDGKSMRIFSVGCHSSCAGIIFLDLIWLFQEFWDGRALYRSRPLCTCVCIMTYVWVFWLHAVFSASGARDPHNQAWHHARGPSCYPSLISTSPATSPHYWQGPDCCSNQSTLMANSFQSCAKPIISHPEPRTGSGEIGQAGKRRTGVILGLTRFTTTHSKTHPRTHTHTSEQSPVGFWQRKCSHSRTH